MKKSLQHKAFILFFGAAFLLLWSLIGAAVLFGFAINLRSGIVFSILPAYLFAWAMTRHATSLDEKIRRTQAEQLVEDAWRIFLFSNPIGWLVLLWLVALLISRQMFPTDDEQEKL